MPALWTISSFSECKFHVFLSHCAEDREWLVWPLYERLKSLRIIPWVDRHHYPAGTDPYEALREEILKCRHIVYLVTLATFDKGRGWSVLEKAYGGLLQDIFREQGVELSRIEFPLFFIARDDQRILRSVWQPIRAKGSFAPPSGDLIDWAAGQIRRFVEQEQRRGLEISQSIQNDPLFRRNIEERDKKHLGFRDRICSTYPVLDPPPSLDFTRPENSMYLPII